ncbi:MAG TPA: hypothetical protein VK122_06995 [Brachybacterium sp.]|nr:hypothetical protein [Brachybacterium sp.]
MAGFLGADTDQLREHAELMRDRARSLEGIRTRVSMLVAYGAEWEGEDAAAFRERWRSEIAPRFDERVSAIEDRGSSLEEQAEQQDEVSEAEEPPGIFENIASILDIGQGIYKGFTDLRKLIDDFPAHWKGWKDAFKGGLGDAWKHYKDELAKGMRKGLKFGEEYSSIAKHLVGKLGLPGELGKWDPLKAILDDGKFPSWLDDAAPKLAKAGKLGGKLIPGLDIVLGAQQMLTGDTAFDKVSGGLSAVGGGLVLAAPLFGPAAPIVAGVGAAAGLVSVGMDLGKLVWDNREAIGDFIGDVGDGVSNVAGAVSDVASNAAESIGNGLESAGNAIQDFGSSIGDALGGLW